MAAQSSFDSVHVFGHVNLDAAEPKPRDIREKLTQLMPKQ